MSNGSDYGMPWQEPVGWLSDHVPADQEASVPLVDEARKLAYYMSESRKFGTVFNVFNFAQDDVPWDRVTDMTMTKGPHMCEFPGCGFGTFGEFAFGKWKLPFGIVHYMLDHNYRPPQEFLDALAKLPDPPAVFDLPSWMRFGRKELFEY
jgi:hypothetical protein